MTMLREIGVEGESAPCVLDCEIMEGIEVGILTNVPLAEPGLENAEDAAFDCIEFPKLEAVLLKAVESVRSSAIMRAKNAALRRIIVKETD
jgi:hypothetical protein